MSELRSFIERILRLREEEDAIKDDVKDVYAELKAAGFDKTVAGKVVAAIRAEKKNSAKVAEMDTLFDLYMAEYRGTSESHAGARVQHDAANVNRADAA